MAVLAETLAGRAFYQKFITMPNELYRFYYRVRPERQKKRVGLNVQAKPITLY
jgi:hypothetical protein